MQAAAATEQQIGPGKRSLAPVVDGDALPAHPFDPAAPEISRSVPIVVGTNKDENTLFSIGDPKFGTMTVDDARNRFKTLLREKGDAAFDFYTQQRPDEKPTYLVTSMGTESGPWISSIRLAERKNAQGAAPVFMYRLDYETPILGGILRSPHGLDTPMVFGHAREFARMLGDGPEPERISASMMDAWIAFARSSNPSTPGLAWPIYEPAGRRTMIFAAETRATADPDKPFREFWSA
jgi:para-nitrobenzyl esterase